MCLVNGEKKFYASMKSSLEIFETINHSDNGPMRQARRSSYKLWTLLEGNWNFLLIYSRFFFPFFLKQFFVALNFMEQ